MTGPEHYREAEKHLRYAAETSIEDGTAGWHQGQAQVHATLAQTAATVFAQLVAKMPLEVDPKSDAADGWFSAISPGGVS